METIFPIGSKIKRADYSADKETLKVTFVKSKGLEQREYSNVPREIGCKFLFQKAAKEIMGFYANNIRGKYGKPKITIPLF